MHKLNQVLSKCSFKKRHTFSLHYRTQETSRFTERGNWVKGGDWACEWDVEDELCQGLWLLLHVLLNQYNLVSTRPVVTASTHASGPTRRGEAPPVNEFSGEGLLEGWLPSLERASMWSMWSEQDLMIQLASHLKGRALQERNYSIQTNEPHSLRQ